MEDKMHEQHIVKTKKQKDYAALRGTLLRIIVSGVLFLLIFLIAEYEPTFIPITIRDIKEALSSNIFEFIK